VAIDPFAEAVLPFAAAARRLPRTRGDKPVSPATIWRWAVHGLRGVRLETIKIGGTTCTSLQALARFFAALQGGRQDVAPAEKAGPAPSAVEKELDRIGI